MSLGLHQNCQQQLIEKIAEYLPEVRVQNRIFLERKSAVMLFRAESILPHGTLKKNLEGYIGETPIFDFIYETLSRQLYETQKYDSDSPSLPLTEIQGYENPTAVAERLIHEFDSLPWTYYLSIKCDNDFGQLFAQTIRNYQISDNAKLITPDEAYAKAFPLESGIETREL